MIAGVFGALGKVRWDKCEMATVEKLRIGKEEMLIKNEEITNFPHVKVIPLQADGFVHLLMSLGVQGKGR